MKTNLVIAELEKREQYFKDTNSIEEAEFMFYSAAELGCLYAIEKANTSFQSRAEVETYLKGRGFVGEGPCDFTLDYGNGGYSYLSFEGNGEVSIDVQDCSHIIYLPLLLLTPALLDKILEAK